MIYEKTDGWFGRPRWAVSACGTCIGLAITMLWPKPVLAHPAVTFVRSICSHRYVRADVATEWLSQCHALLQFPPRTVICC